MTKLTLKVIFYELKLVIANETIIKRLFKTILILSKTKV
jgi:hypothetical protein